MADDIVQRIRDNLPHIEWEQPLAYERERDAADEIERLRRLGDTLAYHVRAGEAKEMYSAVHAWEEARRD